MNKVVYFSRGGNTKKLADAIAKSIGVSAVPIEQFNAANDTDVLFVGASIYAGSIDSKLRFFLTKLNPKQIKTVALFGTSAGKKTALLEVKAILNQKGIAVLDDVFHCKGSFLLANKNHPNDEDIKNAEVFAKRILGDNL